MSTQELGKALSEARIARGLTLHDVERDTRISSKYLQALEEGDLQVLPAPVYARAFMRTYAQYLGLNASALIQKLPGARPEPELPPLPEMGRESHAPLISANWMVISGVIVVMLVVGLFLFWNRGGGNDALTSAPPTVQSTPQGQGAEQPTVAPTSAPVITPGVVPDVVDAQVLVALDALARADLPYFVIETTNGAVPEQTVFQQSPSAGTAADQDTVVTLLVSR